MLNERNSKPRMRHSSEFSIYLPNSAHFLFLQNRQSKSDSILNDSKGGGKSALFYNYELIGDDFFLNVAHLDCKHKIEHIETIGGYKGSINILV